MIQAYLFLFILINLCNVFDMKEKEHKVLLLVGNGFDCDLGLKTKYKDFVESSYFQDNVTRKFDPDRLIENNYDFNIFDYLY